MISSYLTGQLSEDAADAFERALSEQPDLRDEVEQRLKLREGLARLHDRGQLAALVKGATTRKWLPYAAAAALTIITLGRLLWTQVSNHTPAVLALSPTAFAVRGQDVPKILGSYILARTRGDTPEAEWNASQSHGVIELRVVPSTLSVGQNFGVRVDQLNKPARAAPLGQVSAATVAPDGYLTVYLNAGQLTPGQYEVVLVSTSVAGPSKDVDRFTFRVN